MVRETNQDIGPYRIQQYYIHGPREDSGIK